MTSSAGHNHDSDDSGGLKQSAVASTGRISMNSGINSGSSTDSVLGAAVSVSKEQLRQRVASLRSELAKLKTLGGTGESPLLTGCDALDHLFPGGALQRGMIVECLMEGRGGGAGWLAMWLGKRMLQQHQGYFVVSDRCRRFYPPAAIGMGIDPAQLICVRSGPSRWLTVKEELWGLDQALRCPGVTVVVGWLDHIDSHAFRRLQLAAEEGQTLGLLLRPAHVRGRPTWSDVQLLVCPDCKPVSHTACESGAGGLDSLSEYRSLQVTLLRQRGRAGSSVPEGTRVKLELNEQQGTLKGYLERHEPRALSMAPRVAHSATRRRSTGA